MKKTTLAIALITGFSTTLIGCGGGDGGDGLVPEPASNQTTGHTIVTEKTGDFNIQMSLTSFTKDGRGGLRKLAHRTESWETDDQDGDFAFFPDTRVVRDEIKNELSLSFKMDSKPAKFIISWFDEDTGERLAWFEGRGTTNRNEPNSGGTYSFGNDKDTGMGLNPRIYIASCDYRHPGTSYERDCSSATGNGIAFSLFGNIDGEQDGQPKVVNFPVPSSAGDSYVWYDYPPQYYASDAERNGRIFKNSKVLNLTLKVSLCDDSGKCDFATLERIDARAYYNHNQE